jgi:hypothetical protein
MADTGRDFCAVRKYGFLLTNTNELCMINHLVIVVRGPGQNRIFKLNMQLVLRQGFYLILVHASEQRDSPRSVGLNYS